MNRHFKFVADMNVSSFLSTIQETINSSSLTSRLQSRQGNRAMLGLRLKPKKGKIVGDGAGAKGVGNVVVDSSKMKAMMKTVIQFQLGWKTLQ